jgi:hypothetical protein
LTKGEIGLSPMISRTFSTKSGSAESLKVSVRCDCKPKAFQAPWIVAGASVIRASNLAGNGFG